MSCCKSFSVFRRRNGGGWLCAIGLADLEAGKAADGDVFAHLGYGLVDHFLDGGAFVADEVLLVQAILFVKLFHFAGDDLLDYGVGLAGGLGLSTVNFALTVEDVGSDFIAIKETGIERSDVHSDVVTETLEVIGAGDEVAFAVNLDEHANFAAGMNVVADHALAGGALRLLLRGSLSLLA